MLDSILKNLRSMQTRESIVQRLLDERLITTEEAVILLKTEVTKWLPSPNQNPWIGPGIPSYPAQPYQPFTPNQPINVPYCDWHTGTGNPNPVSFTTTYSAPGINKNYTDK
jgi:hypothetical protein